MQGLWYIICYLLSCCYRTYPGLTEVDGGTVMRGEYDRCLDLHNKLNRPHLFTGFLRCLQWRHESQLLHRQDSRPTCRQGKDNRLITWVRNRTINTTLLGSPVVYSSTSLLVLL